MRVYKNSEVINYQLDRYWWRKKAYLTLTGKLLIDLKTQQGLAARVLWEHTYKELQKVQKGISFDRGKAKVNAEFFVGGNAYAYDEKTTTTTAEVAVGNIKKSLQVFGERYWVKSGPLHSMSPALPFKVMPLAMTNSFGGKDFPQNPMGKGLTQTAQQLWPLPNVEYAYELLSSPNQRPAPAGFLPSSFRAPERLKHLGTLDEGWVKTAWPYLPDDHNPLYWNAAPLDQQQKTYWCGNEQISCAHMHPDKPVQHYALADHKIRAFYQRKGGIPQEMLLDFDTIWVFPHLEQALLIWHGTVPVADEIASDLDAILLVEENRQTGTKASADYCALLTEMMLRKPVPLIKPLEKPAPPEKSAEAIEKMAQLKAKSEEKKQQVAAIKAKAQKQMAEAQAALPPDVQEKLAEGKGKPSQAPVYDPTQSMQVYKQQMQAYLETQLSGDPAIKAELGKFKATPVKPIDFNAVRADVIKQGELSDDKTIAERLLRLLDSAEAHAQHLETRLAIIKARTPLRGEEAIEQALLTKQFVNMRVQDHCFKNQLFTGFVFKNTVFKNCQFEDCTFSDSTFDNIRFEATSMQTVNFNHCTMDGFWLKKSHWQSIHWQHTTITKCFIEQCQWAQIIFDHCVLTTGYWQESQFSDCQFKSGSIQQLIVKKSVLTKIKWHAIEQSTVHITDSTLDDVEFIDGEIKISNFVKSKISQLHFEQVKTTGLTWDGCEVNALTIKKSTMATCRFKKCDLNHCQITDASLFKLDIDDSTINAVTVSHTQMESLRMRALTQVYALQALTVNLKSSVVLNCVFEALTLFDCDLTNSLWQDCLFMNAQLKNNIAILSRFMDCHFTNTLLANNNFFTANFKRTGFNNSEILKCNLYRVNFYHAYSNGLQIKHCLLEDPLPIGYWERWRQDGAISCI